MEMATYVHVVDISPLTQHGYEARQGCQSNLWMVRPSLVLVVKMAIIRAQSVRQNFVSSYF